MKKLLCILIMAVLLLPSCTRRERSSKDSSFVLKSSLRCTPVKNQGKVQACWIYAYLACLETERIENFGDSMNLSPMWLVRANLKEQARKYYLSRSNVWPISCRGIGPDAERLMKTYGMVQWSGYCPDDVNGSVLERDIKHKTELAIRNKKGLAWLDNEIESALPKLPHNLIQKSASSLQGRAGGEAVGFYLFGMHYTPQQFAESLLYQVHFTWLTSYTHHPYGMPFAIEVADNYNRNEIMNVPIEQMYTQVVKALKNHHPVYWEGQMGGVKECKSENIIELRQRAFERFETTDQHAMAIVGLTKDGFICKNSWGKDWGMNGYCMMSKKAFLVNTILVGVVSKEQ